MEAYPIIIVHNGNQQYMKTCVKQAHFSNPESRIILIGSNVSLEDIEYVEHYNIKDYFVGAKEFEKYYRHYSVNSRNFELFCFQRWFVIKEFIEKNNIYRFLHIDSDVLLYSDFTKETEYINNIENYDYTISFCCAHTSFFNKQDVLARYCDVLLKYFKDDSFFKQFENDPLNPLIIFNKEIYLECLKPLSDMTFWQYFSLIYGPKCLNTTNFIKNDAIINFNMVSLDPGYAAIGNIYNIIFNKNNLPFLYCIQRNKLVRLHSLHFQGGQKVLMHKYSTFDLSGYIGKINYEKRDLELIFSLKSNNISAYDRLKKAIARTIKFYIRFN